MVKSVCFGALRVIQYLLAGIMVCWNMYRVLRDVSYMSMSWVKPMYEYQTSESRGARGTLLVETGRKGLIG